MAMMSPYSALSSRMLTEKRGEGEIGGREKGRGILLLMIHRKVEKRNRNNALPDRHQDVGCKKGDGKEQGKEKKNLPSHIDIVIAGIEGGRRKERRKKKKKKSSSDPPVWVMRNHVAGKTEKGKERKKRKENHRAIAMKSHPVMGKRPSRAWKGGGGGGRGEKKKKKRTPPPLWNRPLCYRTIGMAVTGTESEGGKKKERKNDVFGFPTCPHPGEGDSFRPKL